MNLVCSLLLFYIQCVLLWFSLTGWGNKMFRFFGERRKSGKFSKEVGTNHPWMKQWQRGKEILIKKVFHLTHTENIEKTKEVLRKLGRQNSRDSKYSIERLQGQCKNDAELTESDVNILWHRVEGGNRNLENHVQSGPWMPHVFLLQFRFFFLWYF